MLNATYKTYNSETDKHTATALTVATYDDKNQLKTLADKISSVAYGWDYDTLDRIKTYTGGRVAESYEYNSDGDVSKKTVTVDGENRVYEYAYKNIAAKDLESVTVGNICLLPKSDCLGRNTGKEIKVNGVAIASETMAYRKVGDHATNMPSAMRFGNRAATAEDKTQFVQLDNLKYKYDNCGNISDGLTRTVPLHRERH